METLRGKRITFVNQSVGDLFADVVNAFVREGVQATLIGAEGFKGAFGYLDKSVAVRRIVRYDNASALRRIFTWGLGTLQIALRILSRRKDEFFFVSNPPFAPLCAPLCKGRFSVLVYDVYPDVLTRAGYLKENGAFARWWRARNRALYARAHRVYAIGEGMAACLSQYVSRQKIVVIPTWTDTSRLKPLAKSDNAFLAAHGWRDKFIVLYSGNFGATHPLEALIDVADALRDKKDIQFVFIGKGAKEPTLRRLIAEKQLENCALLPWQDKALLPQTLGAADIGVVTLDAASSTLSVPSKTYDLLAVGAPLLCIADARSELEGLLKRHPVGVRFLAGETEQMARFVAHLKDDTSLYADMRARARAASRDFTPENARAFPSSYARE